MSLTAIRASAQRDLEVFVVPLTFTLGLMTRNVKRAERGCVDWDVHLTEGAVGPHSAADERFDVGPVDQGESEKVEHNASGSQLKLSTHAPRGAEHLWIGVQVAPGCAKTIIRR
jgi:hypothetical protein